MNFDYSPKTQELIARVKDFMDAHIYPNEPRYFRELEAGTPLDTPALIEELKPKAKAAGLWNLFLPESEHGKGLTNLEYAPLCEIMGRAHWAPEVFNCSAPDTGNMEVLARYGTEEHKKRWLVPLLEGKIRSCFAMTEPAVASSDATNIQSSIRREGDEYVINGHKWCSSGARRSALRALHLHGQDRPGNPDKHKQQSMVIVPARLPGITVVRGIPVFGYDHAPQGGRSLKFENVRVPVSNILLGEGRGFEIAQGRLGPGRIHHCMRLIGLAERALEAMCKRTKTRVAFGRPMADQTVTLERIAEARIMIDQARLLTLNAAYMMDTVGNKVARAEIAMIKVAAPNMAQQVIDWAIQAHGGAGVTDDFGLATCLRHRPLPAHRRRPGRGASQPDRQARTAQIQLSGPRSAVGVACRKGRRCSGTTLVFRPSTG